MRNALLAYSRRLSDKIGYLERTITALDELNIDVTTHCKRRDAIEWRRDRAQAALWRRYKNK